MPMITLVAGSTATAADVNANFANAMSIDTSRTVTATHTFSITQTFNAGWTAAAACIITATAAASFAVGRQGSTDPVFSVDASAGSVVTGVQITGAAAGNRAALHAISSGTNEGLDIDAKGSGTVRVGNTSTGAFITKRTTYLNGGDDASAYLPTNVVAATAIFIPRAANPGILILLRANGSLASPTGVLSGETFGSISFRARSSASTTEDVCNIDAVATQDVGATKGGKLVFKVVPTGSGSAPSTAVTIDQDSKIIGEGGVVSKHATQGVGYATGAGGTVTQGSNKATGVALNTVTGAITTHNANLNDATTVSFTVTNSAVASTDTVSINHSSGGTGGAYIVWISAVGSGSFQVSIRNVSGGVLGEALVLSFNVIKGVTS